MFSPEPTMYKVACTCSTEVAGKDCIQKMAIPTCTERDQSQSDYRNRSVFGTIAMFLFVMILMVVIEYDTMLSDEIICDSLASKGKQNSKSSPFQLRYDWTKLEPLSSLAKNISRHQRELCELPLGFHEHRPFVGIGSNLHVWTQALCVGMERGYRLWTAVPWNARDEELCNPDDISSMTCYFPQSELACPTSDVPATNKMSGVANPIERLEVDPSNPVPSMANYSNARAHEMIQWLEGLKDGCAGVLDQYGIMEFRTAAIEYLFSPVSKILQDEAERQLHVLFGNHGKVPENLVTVHIRWGDKSNEIELVPIERYVQSVTKLINGRLLSGKSSNTESVNASVAADLVDNENVYHHIYVVTEDPQALTAFRNASPKNWIIYEEVHLQMYKEKRTSIGNYFNNHLAIIRLYKGRPALVALGGLLVALQANEYVLSLGSNWSRLINELRKNVVDARCNKCTKMIGLGKPDEWR